MRAQSDLGAPNRPGPIWRLAATGRTHL